MIDVHHVLKHSVINKQAFAISQFFPGVISLGGNVLGEKFFKIGQAASLGRLSEEVLTPCWDLAKVLAPV